MKPGSGIAQFVPVDSAVHRLDARVKIVLAIFFTTALFLMDGFVGLGVLAAAVAFAIALARVPVALAFRGVVAVSLVLAMTMAFQALRVDAPDALLSVGALTVSAGGLLRGAFFALRIVLLVVGSSLVTLTTSPVDLTGAMERLLRPFGRVGLPVHELAMMLTIALRFIPTTAEEAAGIVTAQTARGARFDSGGPVRRARAWVPVIIPLFVKLFRRADTLASAMEARCYRGGEGRTRLRQPVFRTADAVVLVAGIVSTAVIAVVL